MGHLHAHTKETAASSA